MARVSPRHGNDRCPFQAKEVVDISGEGYAIRELHLCVPHFRVLTHRGHLGTRRDLLLRWLA